MFQPTRLIGRSFLPVDVHRPANIRPSLGAATLHRMRVENDYKESGVMGIPSCVEKGLCHFCDPALLVDMSLFGYSCKKSMVCTLL